MRCGVRAGSSGHPEFAGSRPTIGNAQCGTRPETVGSETTLACRELCGGGVAGRADAVHPEPPEVPPSRMKSSVNWPSHG